MNFIQEMVVLTAVLHNKESLVSVLGNCNLKSNENKYKSRFHVHGGNKIMQTIYKRNVLHNSQKKREREEEKNLLPSTISIKQI